MTDSEPAPRRGRGCRPAADVRRAVLKAAADLLYDGGLTAVTFDKVAVRAGSSKMTLYKWPGVTGQPSPHGRILDSYLNLWYGDPDNPVLTCERISLRELNR